MGLDVLPIPGWMLYAHCDVFWSKFGLFGGDFCE